MARGASGVLCPREPFGKCLGDHGRGATGSAHRYGPGGRDRDPVVAVQNLRASFAAAVGLYPSRACLCARAAADAVVWLRDGVKDRDGGADHLFSGNFGLSRRVDPRAHRLP